MVSLACAVVAIVWAQDAARSPGWVVIPVTEYEALRIKADPKPLPPDRPPVDATLTRVDYDLRVDYPASAGAALATGRASLTIDVLKDGWVRVPIPQGLLVREARLGSEVLSLAPWPAHAGQLSAMLSKRGRSVVSLDVALPVSASGGEERLALPASGSGMTRAAVVRELSKGDAQDLDVRVSGGFLAERAPSRWLAYARGHEPLVFTWRRRVEEKRSELPLRMRASLTQLVALGEDAATLNAAAEIEVVQGAATQIRIAVPDTITINQVPGATVADWDVKNGELVVNFLEPVERRALLSIVGEARLPREGAIAIPLLRVLDVERDSGGIAVEVLGAGEVRDFKQQGLEAADASELGAPAAGRPSPSLAAFRWRAGSTARSLNLEVARYTQQAMLTANIEEARYRALMTVDGKTLVQARYAIRNNQRNFARVTLPEGAILWSAALAGKPIRPGTAPDGGLLFPLVKNRAGEEAPLFAMEILYLARAAAWETKGRAALPLPAIDLPVSRTGVVLHYPPLFKLTPEQGAFRMDAYERPQSEVLGRSAQPEVANAIDQASTQKQGAKQALVDRYRARVDPRQAAGAAPIQVSFPSVGPSLFLVSELTGEGKVPVIELAYQKERKK
jgi:hypothetical protein